mmetsp:Transcript_11483/g.21931  ORF Transcript_11483/g.21931 Transcript_11483/m.21931 type:complete len:212 (+) Transcript_11483:3492-4127(+)
MQGEELLHVHPLELHLQLLDLGGELLRRVTSFDPAAKVPPVHSAGVHHKTPRQVVVQLAQAGPQLGGHGGVACVLRPRRLPLATAGAPSDLRIVIGERRIVQRLIGERRIVQRRWRSILGRDASRSLGFLRLRVWVLLRLGGRFGGLGAPGSRVLLAFLWSGIPAAGEDVLLCPLVRGPLLLLLRCLRLLSLLQLLCEQLRGALLLKAFEL